VPAPDTSPMGSSVRKALVRWRDRFFGTAQIINQVATQIINQVATMDQRVTTRLAALDHAVQTLSHTQDQELARLRREVRELSPTLAACFELASSHDKADPAQVIADYGQALTLVDGPVAWHRHVFSAIGALREMVAEKERADILKANLQTDIESLVTLLPTPNRLIWIDPSRVTKFTLEHSTGDSGQVADGDWDIGARDWLDYRPLKCASLHSEQGIPWDRTGAYDIMMASIARFGGQADGCRSMDDVVLRYATLDKIFDTVRQNGFLYTQKYLDERNVWEADGIFVHIGRNREIIFGCGGCHRFVMAKTLGLPIMPAVLGVIHKDATVHACA